MLYVENAYLTSVPYNTTFLAANDRDISLGQNVPASLDQRIDLGVSVNKHGNRGQSPDFSFYVVNTLSKPCREFISRKLLPEQWPDIRFLAPAWRLRRHLGIAVK